MLISTLLCCNALFMFLWDSIGLKLMKSTLVYIYIYIYIYISCTYMYTYISLMHWKHYLLDTRPCTYTSLSLMKDCASFLDPIITKIINLSLSTGSSPLLFEHSLVTPLLKKPSLDKEILSNYRPAVSNLSFISKL